MTYAPVGTRLLVVTIATVDYTAQMSACRITSAAADSDFTTFADAAAGGARKYQLVGTAAQDLQASSLWDQIFSNAGDTVAFLLKPYGNATASATQPHFSGNAVISEPDGDFIGGDANPSTTAKMTFGIAWDLTAKPARVTS
jgi:hypothetical protein